MHNIQKTGYMKILLFFLFVFGCATGFAQQPDRTHLQDHKPLMNEVWKTFDLLMYKVTKQGGKTVYTPHFPERLRRLNGKTVTVSGYMIPFKAGRRHNAFLLSVLPVHQCMFCGQNGIPSMVEVTLAHGKRIGVSEKPITIQGVVYLNSNDKDRTEIQLRDAAKAAD